MKALYTTHDVARLIQVDASTISKWVDKAMLVAFRTPGGHRRIRPSDLRAFLVAHQMPIPDEVRASRFRLLVVDDEKPVIAALQRSLRTVAPEAEVLGLTSVIEALLSLAEWKPHAVLVDLSMPELDGFELCRAVRARPALRDVKLVTMTARHTADTVAKSKRAGALECLGKPVDAAGLLRLVGAEAALKRGA